MALNRTFNLPLFGEYVDDRIRPLVSVVINVSLADRALVDVLTAFGSAVVIRSVRTNRRASLAIAYLRNRAVLIDRKVLGRLIVPINVLSVVAIFLRRNVVGVARMLVVLGVLEDVGSVDPLSWELSNRLTTMEGLHLATVNDAHLNYSSGSAVAHLHAVSNDEDNVLRCLRTFGRE